MLTHILFIMSHIQGIIKGKHTYVNSYISMHNASLSNLEEMDVFQGLLLGCVAQISGL